MATTKWKRLTEIEGQFDTFFAVKYKGKDMGHGLVAKEAIKKDGYIIEHLGNIEEEEMYKVYLMKFTKTKKLYINRVNSTSLEKFINHSCNPNSELVQWCIDDLPCLCFIAIEDIKCEKEITFDYKWTVEKG